MISTQVNIAERLASLFREAGIAHHKAFISTDGEDPEWPIWYARFLQHRLNTLMSAHWTTSEVANLLIKAEHARSLISPRPDWPTFYADAFLEVHRQGT